METIIGLGQAGCSIAEKFKQYPQYDVYRLDSEKRTGSKFKLLKKCDSHEEYESTCPNLKRFFRDAKPPYLFIVGGGGTVSGASLRILEQLKNRDVYILYIKPETDLLSQTRKMQHRVVFNVMQEYARSNMFKRMFVVSNPEVEDIIGGVPITKYFDMVNETIVSAVHMLNVFSNTEPIMSTTSDPVAPARISTFGYLDMETGEKKMFYPLENPREMVYFYSIDADQLESDGSLLKAITQKVKDDSDEKLKVSYGIYSNTYGRNFSYVVSHASKIQEINF
jgi:hypothetical protein